MLTRDAQALVDLQIPRTEMLKMYLTNDSTWNFFIRPYHRICHSDLSLKVLSPNLRLLWTQWTSQRPLKTHTWDVDVLHVVHTHHLAELSPGKSCWGHHLWIVDIHRLKLIVIVIFNAVTAATLLSNIWWISTEYFTSLTGLVKCLCSTSTITLCRTSPKVPTLKGIFKIWEIYQPHQVTLQLKLIQVTFYL